MRAALRPLVLILGATLLSTSLTACFPLAATGIVVGALSLTDRRTTGAQAEDQAIELKALARLPDRLKGDRGVAMGVTSYNRTALITGRVPNEAIKQQVGQIVAGIENVRLVINELQVGAPASTTTLGRDVLLTTKVKATLLDDKLINGNTIKVTTESGVVYLMGLVTAPEADRAADLSSRVPGTAKVVRAFEIISEAQRALLDQSGQSGTPRPEVKGQLSSPAARAPESMAAPAPAAPAKPTPAPAPAGAQVIPVR
ncbi:MAG: BON domain-containing protein [Burkholderiaceae bacterium]|jgi:osmotically-inducible protein OsmY